MTLESTHLTTDADLVARCGRGDRAAWEILVGRYSRLVWSIPRNYGLAEGDCEDVLQTVFAALIRHLDELRSRDRISSWLITTTKRECWRFQRRQRGSRVVASLGPRAGEGDSTAELDVPWPETDRDDEERQLVREHLAQIGERCRELLTALFAAQGEPRYPEIAERLGIPVGSIGPTRARCLAKLEALLRAAGVGDGAR